MELIRSEYRFSSYATKRQWLIAPKTFLLDSFEPSVEEILLPVTSTIEGKLRFTMIHDGKMAPFYGGAKYLFLKKIKHRVLPLADHVKNNVFYIDLRQYSPGNLAHALTIHLPLALCARNFLKQQGQYSLKVVFPSDLPKHIQQLFIELGIDFVLTSSALKANLLEHQLDSLVCLRGGLTDILKSFLSNQQLISELENINDSLPKKIFIVRKDTRKLINEPELETYLSTLGFTKIVMEDYSISEQLSMVACADEIVAIHGAALGPIIFRPLFNKSPLKLIELLSPAHMSNVYRITTDQIGGIWIGVRGKIWPNLIAQAYTCPQDKVRQYSLQDFEICIESLKKAFELMARNGCND